MMESIRRWEEKSQEWNQNQNTAYYFRIKASGLKMLKRGKTGKIILTFPLISP
jgi:hypothetical protein